jgi:hypothetical protein
VEIADDNDGAGIGRRWLPLRCGENNDCHQDEPDADRNA